MCVLSIKEGRGQKSYKGASVQKKICWWVFEGVGGNATGAKCEGVRIKV